MKVIVEANIPYIKGLVEQVGDVEYLPASGITPVEVKDADALFVRTRTRCDAKLLDGSRVKFIATATIGTDHIDMAYCASRGITVCNAPGCNAPAVAQYVFASIGSLFSGEEVKDMTLGVVGVGHVGSIVAWWGQRLGMRVLQCDPPRARKEGGCFVGLDEIARQADIITFHTPLNLSGEDCTVHLADSSFLGKLEHCRLLVNSSRGKVVDNRALVEALGSGKVEAAAIDCWEGEPDIDRELLRKVSIATPHIAGYSREGKMRATAMSLHSFERYFGVSLKGVPVVDAPLKGAEVNGLSQITATYNPLADTLRLKSSPESFEMLRNNYDLRHEVID